MTPPPALVEPRSDGPMDVSAQINRILIDLFELDEASVTPEARIRDELDLDSLDGIDLIVAIEKHFGILAEEGTLTRMQTVRDIHIYVEARLANRSS